MKKIYLILAHNNPVLLERLICRLHDGASSFIVHLDAKTDFRQFKFLEALPHVELVADRVRISWGGIGCVIATLKCMEMAILNHKEGTVILLSGQDYPVKSNGQIDSYLSNHRGNVFMETRYLKDRGHHSDRERKYKVEISENKGGIIMVAPGLSRLLVILMLRRTISLSFALRIATKKRKKLHIPFCTGSQWWAMDIQRLTELLAYIDDNKAALINHYRDSFIADEAFFQTVAMHVWGQVEGVILPSLTFHHFEKHAPSPIVFKSMHQLVVLQSLPNRTLFARKFDANSGKLIDALDALNAAR